MWKALSIITIWTSAAIVSTTAIHTSEVWMGITMFLFVMAIFGTLIVKDS